MQLNLLYRAGMNRLQDAGDLDGQILADLSGLRDRLLAYQQDHLDAKVKGRSNHYEQWSEENARKLAWTERLLELASRAASGEPAVPESFDRAGWDALNPKFREPAVTAMAVREVSRIGPYDASTVYVEKQSFHPDDWYLWSVAACATRDGRAPEWACWTLNLSTGAMNGGHYGLSCQDLKAALAAKKNVALCRPGGCGGNEE